MSRAAKRTPVQRIAVIPARPHCCCPSGSMISTPPLAPPPHGGAGLVRWTRAWEVNG